MSGDRYAVLIGNNEFPKNWKLLPRLRCPLNDVEGLRRVLAAKEHGAFITPVVLKNEQAHVVLQEVSRALKRADKNDLVLIYYSGHGKLNSRGRLHLATVDTDLANLEPTSVPVNIFRDYFDESPSRKIVLILDCCYSGQAGRDLVKGDVKDQLAVVFGGDDSRGTYVLSASSAVQVATEKEGDQYSLLTKYLVEGIEKGLADFDDDGEVSVDDLYRYATEQMREVSSQAPMKTALNVQGGDLVLARTGKQKGDRRADQIRAVLYARKQFRDRYILMGLTAGGALGAGVGLFFLRTLIGLTMELGGTGPARALNAFFVALVLGAALTFGMALPNQLWKGEEETKKKEGAGWASVFQSRGAWGILFGTLGFGIAQTVLSLIIGAPSIKTILWALGTTLVAGAALSVSLWNQPQAGWKLGWLGWAWRISFAAILFALAQLPYSFRRLDGTGFMLTWGFAFYRDKFAFLDQLSPQFASPARLATLDAALLGATMMTFMTIGIAKAGDWLIRWLKVIETD